MSFALLTADRAAHLQAEPFTYAEVGHTRGPHPAGFRSISRTAVLPAGTDFVAACDELFGWQVQQRAGIGVEASSKVVERDGVAELLLGPGPLAVRAPVRVAYVIDEPTRRGFAYGTLPGHPETGEELFVLSMTAGVVELAISAFSRDASLAARISGPIGHWVQHAVTERYLRSFATS